jgi:hypothetical protein
MTPEDKKYLDEKFNKLSSKIEEAREEASDKGHTFVIIALIILLLNGCS